MSAPPFLLTPSEADSLRQEMQSSYEWAKQELQRRRMEKEPLLEQDGPILSSLPNPFDPGAKVDSRRLANYAEAVKEKSVLT